MIEVLWHGRGGQGAFTAARLLGAAASLADGKHALAFPSFGPERRGAPMRAFTKMDDAPIGNRSAVTRADYVVYLDESLLGPGWEDELKPDGKVLVNSAGTFGDKRIAAIDADGISSAILGRPIPNTVFLGALSALCDRVAVDDVKEAIRQYMPAKLHEANLCIVDAARAALLNSSAKAAADPASLSDDPSDQVVRAPASAAAERPPAHIPTLRTATLDPDEFAHTTCFEAGYLVGKNAGWRNVRPVVDAGACTGCLQCYLLCPDGTVYKVPSACRSTEQADAAEALADVGPLARSGAPVAIDYDFCKGCGVCAKACRFGAIAMIPESEADAR